MQQAHLARFAHCLNPEVGHVLHACAQHASVPSHHVMHTRESRLSHWPARHAWKWAAAPGAGFDRKGSEQGPSEQPAPALQGEELAVVVQWLQSVGRQAEGQLRAGGLHSGADVSSGPDAAPAAALPAEVPVEHVAHDPFPGNGARRVQHRRVPLHLLPQPPPPKQCCACPVSCSAGSSPAQAHRAFCN